MSQPILHLRSRRPTAPALARSARTVLLSLTLLALGCNDHGHGDKDDDDHHGHGHAKPATKAADKGDGHEGHAHEVKLSPEGVRRYGIRLDAVKSQALVPSFVAPARVAFNAEAVAHVGSAVPGRVAELKAKVGDSVKKGDELVVVESPALGEAQSEFLQRRTAVAAATAAAEPARLALERGKSLFEQNQGISGAELQKREAEFQAAQSSLQSARAALAAARSRLGLYGMDDPAIDALGESGRLTPRYAVRAPIDGRVVEREATPGELVGPDKQSLLVLADLSAVWVLADVAEARLGEVAVGAPARVTVPAAPGEPYEGTVARVADTIDPATRSAQVRVEVPNRGGTLKPGMFARAEIWAARPADAKPVLVVPEEAVQTVEGRAAVFVPDGAEEHTFAVRPVDVGRPVGGLVPVRSGLTEGERVVVNGSFILKAELGKEGAEHDHH